MIYYPNFIINNFIYRNDELNDENQLYRDNEN